MMSKFTPQAGSFTLLASLQLLFLEYFCSWVWHLVEGGTRQLKLSTFVLSWPQSPLMLLCDTPVFYTVACLVLYQTAEGSAHSVLIWICCNASPTQEAILMRRKQEIIVCKCSNHNQILSLYTNCHRCIDETLGSSCNAVLSTTIQTRIRVDFKFHRVGNDLYKLMCLEKS